MTTEDRPWNVLFLCRANSARSQIAEVLLNRMAQGRFKAYSAGSQPAQAVHPLTFEVLKGLDYPLDQLRPKDWAEFGKPDAPVMDFVFTVCDDTAGEVCPAWPGQPMTAHWGVSDPAAVTGNEALQMTAFGDALRQIRRRLEIFVELPIEKLDRLSLQSKVDEIGRTTA
ncbi:arsenate reductase ArsC [Orrella daihaiensis]|uniref:Arsenate reductase ArsC n=1 Tax=Orrella daihaiensis TaxID=2782176 RepID=A0ABY4AN06_9BURK|nr:arsenate reductase ArsC [Orrella daihaiensis]UOD50455.1 arsenate reductase ArsC [Orrella daihaiensis]